MEGHHADLPYPNCCVFCPHLAELTASCTHEFRQSLLRELSPHRSCPVYSEAKTAAMRQLADSQ